MPSVIKQFVFLTDLEGFTLDSPSAPNATLAWQAADGDPSNGCLSLIADWDSDPNINQKFRSPLTTWEGWLVPPTAEVLQVRITGINGKTIGAAATKNLSARIVDETNTTIHSAGDLLATAYPAPSTWTALGPGALRDIDFLYQESTQQVRLELQLVGANASGTTDFRLDSIELTITYDDGGGSSMAIPIQNLDGLVFMKGFAYASRIGGTPDAVGMAALQECSISHSYSYAYARGPESLQNLGVGVTEESLTGSIRHMVCTAEQFQVFLGGTMSYSGGTLKTTYVKKVNEEPSAFNLHLKTPEDGSDMEVYVYKCLCTNQPVIEGGANREFKTFGVDWKAEGQNTAEGSKLFEIIFPGNQTGSS